MMKSRLAFVLAAALSAPALGMAGEHPGGREHPAKHEHPAKEKTPKWVKHKETMKAFVGVVEGHVSGKKKQAGAFEVRDGVLDKTWRLELKKIHKKRIARLTGDKFFACADFTSVGEKPKTELDLDFFVTKTADGWNVDEVVVHKISGRPRYTYNADNERVPVPAGGKHVHSKECESNGCKLKGRGHPSGKEHPSASEHPH